MFILGEVKTVTTTTCTACNKEIETPADNKCPECKAELKQDVAVTVTSLSTFGATL